MHVQPAHVVERQGIDGKVAGRKIFFDVSAAQGHTFPAAPQADMHTLAHEPGIRMAGQKIFHAAGKGEVQFHGRTPEQHVAHSAANEVEFHG